MKHMDTLLILQYMNKNQVPKKTWNDISKEDAKQMGQALMETYRELDEKLNEHMVEQADTSDSNTDD